MRLDPKHTQSLLGTTRVYLGLRRPAEALALAQKVIAREPFNAEAFFLAGLASSALKAPREAATFFERAANLQPQNIEFRRALERAIQGSALSAGPSAWSDTGIDAPPDRHGPLGLPAGNAVR